MSVNLNDAALAAFEAACRHDRDGDEAGAIPLYREALAAGLSPELQPNALVGLAAPCDSTPERAWVVGYGWKKSQYVEQLRRLSRRSVVHGPAAKPKNKQ